MNEARWPGRTLAAVGAVLLLLTGLGLFLQQREAHDAFITLELAQGMLYLLAVWLVLRFGPFRRRLLPILAVAALMRLGVVLAPPYLSDDLYRYVWDGRVEAAGINPYRYVPSDTHLAALRDEAIYPNINRRTYAPTIYPPAAEYIFFLASRISESPLGMKAAMVALECASVAVLLHLLVLAGQPLERILIYAWHPLALWEFAGSGHIDAAVVTFVALALWARRRDLRWLTGIAVAAAALVKFFPAVIFPALYRRWDWKMPLAAAATVVLAYLPFLGVGRAVLGFLPGYVAEEGLNNGAGFFLWNLAAVFLPVAKIGGLAYVAFAGAALLAGGLYVLLREETSDHVVMAALALAALLTLLVSPHFAWYFAWLLAFLCLAPSPAVLYLSVAAILLYFIGGGPDLDGGRMLVELAIYGPFAVLAVIEWRRHRGLRPEARWIKREA
jgi:alpha-1,6-mannosyltransferase